MTTDLLTCLRPPCRPPSPFFTMTSLSVALAEVEPEMFSAMPALATAAFGVPECRWLGLVGLAPVAADGLPLALPTIDVAADVCPAIRALLLGSLLPGYVSHEWFGKTACSFNTT